MVITRPQQAEFTMVCTTTLQWKKWLVFDSQLISTFYLLPTLLMWWNCVCHRFKVHVSCVFLSENCNSSSFSLHVIRSKLTDVIVLVWVVVLNGPWTFLLCLPVEVFHLASENVRTSEEMTFMTTVEFFFKLASESSMKITPDYGTNIWIATSVKSNIGDEIPTQLQVESPLNCRTKAKLVQAAIMKIHRICILALNRNWHYWHPLIDDNKQYRHLDFPNFIPLALSQSFYIKISIALM